MSLDELRRFLTDPAGQFLRQLGLRLPDEVDLAEDIELLVRPERGIERARLQQHVFEWLLDRGRKASECSPTVLYRDLRARALLPSGPIGRRAVAQLLAEIEPYAQAFADWCSHDRRHQLHEALTAPDGQEVLAAVLAGKPFDGAGLCASLAERRLFPWMREPETGRWPQMLKGPEAEMRRFLGLLEEAEKYAWNQQHWLEQVQWRGYVGRDGGSVALDIELDGTRLHGRIADFYPHGLMRMQIGALSGSAAIRHGLDWLLLNARGAGKPLVQFYDAGEAGIGPHVTAAVSADQARAALSMLLGMRRDGLRAPLLFAPYTGWEIYNAASVEKRDAAARAKWYPSDFGWGESTGAAIQLALRGRDPLADPDSFAEFVDNSLRIYSAVRKAVDIDAEGAA